MIGPMPNQPHDPDRVIQLVQSSTKNLMESFRGKTELLRQCSKDIKLLIREGYDKRTAYDAAIKLFGKDRTKFIAIDGTESQDQELDMLVFYAGAFGYVGQIKFENTGKGCSYDEPVEFENNMNISAAIPVHEQDTAKVAGQVTEGGIEVDTERIPSTLMNLSEYYMAVRAVTEDPEIQVVMLDRTLAGDLSHLVWSVNEMLESDSCVLLGIDTSYGKITSLDLELTRMLHPNDSLGTPAARSHLLKYAAILQLMKMNNHAAATATTTSSSAAHDAADSSTLSSSSSSTNTTITTNVEEEGISYENLLSLIGGNKERLEKLQIDITKFNERYAMLDDRVPVGLKLKQGVDQYWERVFEASMKLCEYIFNTPEGKHPLVIEKEKSPLPQQRQEQEEQEQQMSTTTRNSSMEEAAAGIHETETTTRSWITANDLDYLLLVMIYALLRLAWQRSVLIFGIIKDVNSAELVKTVVPILETAGKIELARQLPLFNSDKMLLQTASVINGAETEAPWRSIEFDACFRTIAPIIVDAQRAPAAVTGATTGTTTSSTIGTSPSTAAAVVNVTGAFKNVISSERMFIKSYMQLWCSDTDPAVRSHVFSYDRPCYSEFDYYDPKKKKKDTGAPTYAAAAAEVVLQHIGEKVKEEIVPVVHFEYDSPISHLIMDILCSMSSEVIPECLGYNYPLFLADKKAKSILEGSKLAYLSTITFEMANSEFDQQVLFAARFREYRSAIESKRRKGITT